MSRTAKLLLVMVLCIIVGSVAWLQQRAASSRIRVSVQSVPEAIKNGDKVKILLKAEANSAGLSHGDVLLDFWPLDREASAMSTPPLRVVGLTDREGLFITGWSPPCVGRFMISATVKKGGHNAGAKACYLMVSQ